jgi:hypothetical protein
MELKKVMYAQDQLKQNIKCAAYQSKFIQEVAPI